MAEVNRKTIDSILNRIKSRQQNNGKGTKFVANRYGQAFLPPGKSTIRLFVDPNEEIYREIRAFVIPKRGQVMDPSFYRKDQLDGHDVSAIVKEIRDILDEVNNWRLNPRYSVLIYGHVVKTENPSDYFKPGNTYVISANGRFRTAFDTTFEGVSENPEYLMNAINPHLTGHPMNIDLVKGAQGSASVNPSMGKPVEVTDLDDRYVPLADYAVPDKYDPERTEELLEFLREELKKHRAAVANNPPEEETKDSDESEETSTSEGEKKETSTPSDRILNQSRKNEEKKSSSKTSEDNYDDDDDIDSLLEGM